MAEDIYMKYARDRQTNVSALHTAELLFEALPWIKNLAGKTVVIKYGGAAMVDAELRDTVMSDIVLLKLIGMNPVIVHGGGKAISAAMEASGLPVEFKGGQRVTTPEAMEVVREVLVGKVNLELVNAVNKHGNLAVGVSGCDAGTIQAEQYKPELQRVGRIEKVHAGYLEDLIAADYIPVVATVGMGADGGYYNINADLAAGHVAAAVGAHKAIFLTDVDGLYEDFADKDSLLSNLTLEEAEEMVLMADKGMIPKLQSCVYALKHGVFRTHIINGTTPHSLLLELLTDTGIGTVIHATREAYEFDYHPLGKFASRLAENI